MICKSYDRLSVTEKIEFIGQIVHLIQTDELEFRKARHSIALAMERGKLDGVTINPPQNALETFL